MVECKSLIEFCRAFEKHRTTTAPNAFSDNRTSQSRYRRSKSLNPLSHPFCDHSSFAAIDAMIVILVMCAISVLTVPYFKLIFYEAYRLFPDAVDLIGDVVSHAPVAYGIGLVVAFASGIMLWEVIGHHARKCGKPCCRGLRKAVEFDIQLESEECIRPSPLISDVAFGMGPLELGYDHKELEAELKKMAPINGRTVLIFRAPCGCPRGRLEVWGSKTARRIKK